MMAFGLVAAIVTGIVLAPIASRALGAAIIAATILWLLK